MTKAYDNSLLARNISVSGTNTSVSGLLSVTSGNFIDSLQVNGINVSISGHNHTASQIADFASAVSGYAPPTTDASLLTSGTLSDGRLSANVVLTNDIRLSDSRTPITHSHNISDVTGLQTALDNKQASGSYAASSHTHSSSDITDFNSGVSGLLPVTDIIAGSNISVTSASGIYTVNSIPLISYSNTSSFPASGVSTSYYLASDSSRFYQWTGSQYVEIGPSLDTISASNITFGTLPDERLSNNITRNDNLRWSMQANTNSIDWLPRGHGTIGNASMSSGQLALMFFTAPYNMTCTRLTFVTGGTATASLSLCRFALFTVNETITDSVTATTPVVTMVARTASDTTIGNTQQTIYTRTFNTTDGYPASYDLVAGTRYAAGIIVVGTTGGTWQAGTVTTGAFMRLPPMVAGIITGLTDAPTAATSVSAGNFMLYGRIS